MSGTGTPPTVAGGTTAPVDLSTPAQRLAFCNAITGGYPGSQVLPGLANIVSANQSALPIEVAMLLNMQPGATYAQAATLLQSRWATGPAIG